MLAHAAATTASAVSMMHKQASLSVCHVAAGAHTHLSCGPHSSTATMSGYTQAVKLHAAGVGKLRWAAGGGGCVMCQPRGSSASSAWAGRLLPTALHTCFACLLQHGLTQS